MKILAVTGDKTVLVEATRDELAKVAGQGSEYARFYDSKNGRHRFEIGDTIRVDKAWEKLQALDAAKSRLKAAKSGLLDVAAALEPIGDLIEFKVEAKEGPGRPEPEKE